MDDKRQEAVLKDAAIWLLKRGEITMAEAARKTGASKQSVAYWMRDIDWPAAREKHLDSLWRSALRRARK